MKEYTLEKLYATLMKVTGGEKMLPQKRRPYFSTLAFEEPKTPKEEIDLILFRYLDFEDKDYITAEYNKLSDIEKAKKEYFSVKKKINNLKITLAGIYVEILHLKDEQAKHFESVIKEGLTDELQKRGQELQKQKDAYNYLKEVFESFEENLNEDLKSFETNYQAEFRKFFGERLRQARKAKQMTLEELAATIGIKRTTANLYELGCSDPSSFTLYRICEVLKVSPNFLLNIESED